MTTSRRTFLAGAAAGFTLSGLLRAEAAAGIGSSRKSIIQIHLDGGPPSQDMIDPKPEAPREIRGEFEPIATRLPGVFVSELLPKLADRVEKMMLIRSLVGAEGAHDAFQCQSGFAAKDLRGLGGRPALGCVVNKLYGKPSDPAPAFVDLMQGRGLVRDSARPGFLGPAYPPFRPDMSRWFQRGLEDGMVNELAKKGGDRAIALELRDDLPASRVSARTSLLAGLDRLKREADGAGTMDAVDAFTKQAVGILTSGRFGAALDLERAPGKEVERYCPPGTKDETKFATSDTPLATKKFFLARRMIEAGVRCVNISLSDFDTHSDNFPRMRHVLPILDHGLATLIDDLSERDLWRDTAIVVWGEFGRTPIIGKNGGRDHWPQVGMCMLMGGNIPGGVVIGATDRTGGHAIERPVTYKDVFATLYHHLGVDPRRVTLNDPTGRPQYLLDAGEVIRG